MRSCVMDRLSRLSGNVFSGVPLDRAAHLRNDSTWLGKRLEDPASRFVAVWNQHLIINSGDAPEAFFHTRESLGGLFEAGLSPALLGVETGDSPAAHFALDLSLVEEEAVLERSPGGVLMDLRELVQIIPSDQASLLSYARGLSYWQRTHRFCGRCGHPTRPTRGGHEMICGAEACGAAHFPRTDSAVIVLVHDGDECLLCRQSRWPPGMHSTLAGFLEPGESLEECVAREILEESNIRVADVRYHSSQPWPFPGTIMVGFMAQALNRDIEVDQDELEYAHWYKREDLLNLSPDDSFNMPGDYSISRRLIEDWLAGRIPP